MSKFKKGDVVRRIKESNWPEQYGKVGEVYTVLDEYCTVIPGMPGAMESAFELVRAADWQPKVGERVVVSYGHGWDGAGVLTKVYAKTADVVMDSGDFAGNEGGFAFSHLAPFRIEAGRYYRTRDGRKVGPMKASNGFFDYEWKFTVDHDFIASYGKAWRADGTFSTERGREHSADLIAEWVEPAVAGATATPAKPVVAATVDYLADEYGAGVTAKPKFKVGDVVDYKRDRDGQWLGVTIDRVGETSFGTMGYWGRGRDGHTGLFKDDDIVLARPTTHPTAIVALIENGQPKPSNWPYVHKTVESANKEAARLANVHRGKQFGVYVLTGKPVVNDRPAYAHEWQRQAVNGNKIAAIRELRGITGMGLKPAKDAVEYFLAVA